MKICPKCGSQLRDDTVFCSRCGTNLEATEKRFCPRCNAEIKSSDAIFCRSCGLKFDNINRPIVHINNNIPKICCHCGTLLRDENVRFCKLCGGEFTAENKPLPLGDDDKYYRLCKYCGTAHEIRTGAEVCRNCGTKLDKKPQASPYLSDEDQSRLQQRIANELQHQEQKLADERKRREMDIVMQERAKKNHKEQELAAKERRTEIQKRVLKITGILTLAVVLCTGIGVGAWLLTDRSNIKKAEAALCENDYTQALELYGKINGNSRYYKQVQTRIGEINKAVDCYEQAQKSIEKPSYLDAMAQCTDAKKCNTNMPMIDELYTKAQNGLSEYINKLLNEENYKDALAAINKIDAVYKNDDIMAAEAAIMDKVKAYYSSGSGMLNTGDLDAALTNLKAAQDIAPDYTDDTNLKTKLAEAYTEQAEAKYNAGSMDAALELVKKASEVDDTYKNNAEIKNKIAAQYVLDAKARFTVKDMQSSLDLANKALEMDPSNSEAKTIKEEVEEYNKNPQRAVWASEKRYTTVNAISTYENAYGFDSIQYKTTEYYIENNINYIPVETLAVEDVRGYSCKYNFENVNNLKVIFGISLSSVHYADCSFTADSQTAYIDRLNGLEKVTLPIAPKNIDGHFCIPADTLEDFYIGCKIVVNSTTNEMTITMSQT
ncbi:MAG TPA: hypothetical protein DCG28_03735 [Lachnospiraceae bacterium]|nr:hypothetical protein [Lachnospiraceae bacterium]